MWCGLGLRLKNGTIRHPLGHKPPSVGHSLTTQYGNGGSADELQMCKSERATRSGRPMQQ